MKLPAIYQPKPTVTTHERLMFFEPNAGLDPSQSFAQARSLLYLKPYVSRLVELAIVPVQNIARLNHTTSGAVEGALPIANHPQLTAALGECALVYLTRNKIDRTSARTTNNGTAIIEQALQVTPTHINPDARLAEKGLGMHILHGGHADVPTGLVGLYQQYGLCKDAARELLDNPNTTVAYAADRHGLPVSMATAATSIIPITVHHNGEQTSSQLTMTEITDAFTVPQHRGNGVFGAIRQSLVQEVRNNCIANVFFCEANLAEPGVLFAARQSGFNFVYADAGIYGITNPNPFGVLRSHYAASPDPNAPYTDYALGYLPLPVAGESSSCKR